MINTVSAVMFLMAYLAIFLRPILGTLFVWIVVFAYPVCLFHGILPLDIGYNDIWIGITLLAVCLRTPGRTWTNPAVLFAVSWFVILFLGNLVGLLTGGTAFWLPIVKTIGKLAYAPILALCLSLTIATERDIRLHLLMIILAAIIASFISIVQVNAPQYVKYWDLGNRAYLYSYGNNYRVGGSLGIVSMSYVAGCAILLSLRLSVHNTGTFMKTVGIIGFIICGIALGYTVTRSTIAGVILSFIYSLCFCSKRIASLTLVIIGIFLVIASTTIEDRVSARLVGAHSQSTLQSSAKVRLDIVQKYISQPSIHYLAFGRGVVAEQERLGQTAHNSYIGAVAYSGIFGAIIMVIIIIYAWKRAAKLRNMADDAVSLVLGETLSMIIIMLLVIGVVSEVFQSRFMMLFFGLWTLLEIRIRQLTDQEETKEKCQCLSDVQDVRVISS